MEFLAIYYFPLFISTLARRCVPSISSTSISQSGVYCTSSVGSRVYPLCQMTPHSNRRQQIRNRSLQKICGEFGIDPSTDFRFTHGKNNGFGTVYIWVTYSGPKATAYHYPDPDLALFDDERVTKITDPNYKANGISYVRNDQGADKQFEYFVPNYSQGMTYPGLARINQSIEAYCYCILARR